MKIYFLIPLIGILFFCACSKTDKSIILNNNKIDIGLDSETVLKIIRKNNVSTIVDEDIPYFDSEDKGLIKYKDGKYGIVTNEIILEFDNNKKVNSLLLFPSENNEVIIKILNDLDYSILKNPMTGKDLIDRFGPPNDYMFQGNE